MHNTLLYTDIKLNSFISYMTKNNVIKITFNFYCIIYGILFQDSQSSVANQDERMKT